MRDGSSPDGTVDGPGSVERMMRGEPEIRAVIAPGDATMQGLDGVLAAHV
jgi:hypothetical protein